MDKGTYKDLQNSTPRMTDNTMTEMIWTKGQTKIYKTVHKKQRSSITNPLIAVGVLRYFGKENSCCSTCGTRRATLVTTPVVIHE